MVKTEDNSVIGMTELLYLIETLRQEGGDLDQLTKSTLFDLAEYKRKEHTVDFVVELYVNFQFEGVVFVERGREPFKGSLALPGGFIDYDEVDPTGELLPAAYAGVREVKEETGLDIKGFTYIDEYNNWGRDPSLQRINTAFFGYAFVDSIDEVVAGDDAVGIKIFKYDEIPTGLAFDHNRIIDYARNMSNNSRY